MRGRMVDRIYRLTIEGKLNEKHYNRTIFVLIIVDIFRSLSVNSLRIVRHSRTIKHWWNEIRTSLLSCVRLPRQSQSWLLCVYCMATGRTIVELGGIDRLQTHSMTGSTIGWIFKSNITYQNIYTWWQSCRRGRLSVAYSEWAAGEKM